MTSTTYEAEEEKTDMEKKAEGTEAEVSMTQPEAKESWGLPGAGRGRKAPPCSPWRERGPADT